MRLSVEEILIILETLRKQHGPGYAPGAVGKLQAKLSVMLKAAARRETEG